MMTKHRIGRVQLPWTNLDPPIRHPDYYKNLKLREKEGNRCKDRHSTRAKCRSWIRGFFPHSTAFAYFWVHATIPHLADNNFKAAALIGKKLIAKKACVSRPNCRPANESEKLPLIEPELSPVDVAEEKRKIRERFAIDQEDREREEGRRDNPSLDLETQRAIELDYRALHEQIKAEGLYQCRYSNYAWESLRYGVLFVAFGVFLYYKWYMTSAVFLGLFWVCFSNSFVQAKTNMSCHSNKSCSQHTTPATAALQAILLLTRSSAPSSQTSAVVLASAGGSRLTTCTTSSLTCLNMTLTSRIFLCFPLLQPT